MNKHLELLQWCIDNESNDFTISYTFNIGKSWIHALGGDVAINCIEEGEIDEVIAELNEAKMINTSKELAEKRKIELLAELEKLNATLSN